MKRPRLPRLGRLWAGVLLGWLSAAAIAGIVALLIIFGGIYNTAADNPHLKIVAWAIHRTMISSVVRRAPDVPLRPLTAAALISGAREYEAHCISCHGGPGVARAPWASELLPTPPFLLDSRAHWTPGQLRELVAHGVKMTAMPAWEHVLPPGTIDDLVALLEVMPEMNAAQFQALREHVRALPMDPLAGSGPTASLAPNPMRETQPLPRTVIPGGDKRALIGRARPLPAGLFACMPYLAAHGCARPRL